MKKLYWIIFAVLLNGCASLTETQINSVNQFAATTKDFSDYPKKVMTELASIRKESRLFDANAQIDRTEHIKRLEDIYSEMQLDKKYSLKIEITFKVLDKYAQSLLLLSSKDISDLQKQTKNFGIEIDSLITLYNAIDRVKKIPTGIGAAVSQLVASGGKVYVRSRQATELKKFIPRGNILITHMTANLIEFLEKKIYVKSVNDSVGLKDLIISQQKSLEIDYGSYLTSVFAKAQLPTIENDKKYIALLSRLNDVEELRKKTVSATKALQKAHAKLDKDILTKKTLKESVKEIQLLYDEVKDIRSTISDIQNP